MYKCGFYFTMSRYQYNVMCSDLDNTLDKDFCSNATLFNNFLKLSVFLSNGKKKNKYPKIAKIL